jgi:long-chain acyl-CoA synthetase
MSETLADLLSRQAAENPQRPALIQGDSRISYRELWQAVCTLAERLHDQGVREGDRAVLFMDNGMEYVVAYYALLRLAAVPVPLNTGLKARQLAPIVSHAQSRLILHAGSRALMDKLGGDHGAVPTLEVNRDELLGAESTRAQQPNQRPASLHALSALVYTSGTTGRPKGVMLSAGNLVANVRAIVDYLNLSKHDRGICVLPFYYAYGSSVLHTHLAVGAGLVIENNLLYPQRLLERMSAEQVTGFAGVPSTFRLLLRRCDLGRFPMPHLRYATQAGGAIAGADLEAMQRAWSSADFFVMYGQTEATARLTYLPPNRLKTKAGSVGVPVAGVRLKIMDDQGREKPCGETGEICAAGPNIMLGYWRDDEATAKKFFGEWLRTGDLGYRDAEGYFTVVGRSSEMIKTGDHRVAPEEVEQVIAELDSVEEVAVVGTPDELLGQVIKAFVVPASGMQLNKRDILRHCSLHCAQYKIPKAIEFLPALPKTTSGKVQRYKLLQTRAATNAVTGSPM